MGAKPVQGMALLLKTANVIVLATPSNYAVVVVAAAVVEVAAVAAVAVVVVVVVAVVVEVELEEVERTARIVM